MIVVLPVASYTVAVLQAPSDIRGEDTPTVVVVVVVMLLELLSSDVVNREWRVSDIAVMVVLVSRPERRYDMVELNTAGWEQLAGFDTTKVE